jgi:hypothetical protein
MRVDWLCPICSRPWHQCRCVAKSAKCVANVPCNSAACQAVAACAYGDPQ